MKILFILAGVVIGHGTVHLDGATVAPPDGVTTFEVADDSPVTVGWAATAHGDGYTFAAPPTPYELLTPMTIYMAFTPAERIAIKASTDPYVKEFWEMYQLSVQLEKPTDPNLVSVQEAIYYLGTPKTATPPGAGLLSSPERIPQVLAGIPQ